MYPSSKTRFSTSSFAFPIHDPSNSASIHLQCIVLCNKHLIQSLLQSSHSPTSPASRSRQGRQFPSSPHTQPSPNNPLQSPYAPISAAATLQSPHSCSFGSTGRLSRDPPASANLIITSSLHFHSSASPPACVHPLQRHDNFPPPSPVASASARHPPQTPPHSQRRSLPDVPSPAP